MNSAQRDADPSVPTVTVRGEALLRAEPDEAVLWIGLSALEDAAGAALSDVAARSRGLSALLDELGVDKADRMTSGITVAEEFDQTAEGRQSLGHRAVSRVVLRLADPDLIGRVIVLATEELSARVEGPRWLIAPDNPIRLGAAREAAADARRKAEAYAKGVDATVGRLIRLSEAGEPHVMKGVRLSAGSHEQMPVEPGEHAVVASIEATFALDVA
jgi:uncharacterized protein YggE